MLRPIAILLTFTLVSIRAQQTPQPPRLDREPEEVRLPSGKLQKEEILRVDHEKSLADAASLLKAAQDLKIELERTDRHVLSISSLKQLDNIEKLTKRLRSRLKKN
jgi:hypothetical protein